MTKGTPKYYYVAIQTKYGFTFVTEIDNSTKQFWWDADKEPLKFTKTGAEEFLWALKVNGYSCFIVENLFEPITEQFLVTQHDKSCKIKIVDSDTEIDIKLITKEEAERLDKFIVFPPSYNASVYYEAENVKTDSYSCDFESGRIDYSTSVKDYKSAHDAISDVLNKIYGTSDIEYIIEEEK